MGGRDDRAVPVHPRTAAPPTAGLAGHRVPARRGVRPRRALRPVARLGVRLEGTRAGVPAPALPALWRRPPYPVPAGGVGAAPERPGRGPPPPPRPAGP